MKIRVQSIHAALIAFLLLGAALRIGYTAVTPLDTRGHDIYAHTDYIHYVADTGRMPPAQEGWEYHQPPAYYFLAAAWAAPFRAIGVEWDPIHRQLQWWSVVFSIATLAVGLFLGLRVFGGKGDRRLFFLYGLLLSTFTGLIYFSSRVSNDALYQLFAFGILWALIEWWQRGRAWQWYLLCALIGVGLVIKVSIVVFVPVVLLCVVLRPGVSWRQKAWMGAQFLCILALLSGWLPLLRLMEADATRFLRLGNVEGHLDPRVVLGNHFFNYFQFSPVRMFDIPYNSAYIDDGGRQYYWEYFFKSFYLGEWDFGPDYLTPVRGMILSAMIVVPLSLFGIYTEWRGKSRVLTPMLATMALFQLASIVYRVRHTCSCNQDYRFVPILIIPVFYFALRGAQGLPRVSRVIAYVVLGLSAWFSVQFMVQLFVA